MTRARLNSGLRGKIGLKLGGIPIPKKFDFKTGALSSYTIGGSSASIRFLNSGERSSNLSNLFARSSAVHLAIGKYPKKPSADVALGSLNIGGVLKDIVKKWSDQRAFADAVFEHFRVEHAAGSRFEEAESYMKGVMKGIICLANNLFGRDVFSVPDGFEEMAKSFGKAEMFIGALMDAATRLPLDVRALAPFLDKVSRKILQKIDSGEGSFDFGSTNVAQFPWLARLLEGMPIFSDDNIREHARVFLGMTGAREIDAYLKNTRHSMAANAIRLMRNQPVKLLDVLVNHRSADLAENTDFLNLVRQISTDLKRGNIEEYDPPIYKKYLRPFLILKRRESGDILKSIAKFIAYLFTSDTSDKPKFNLTGNDVIIFHKIMKRALTGGGNFFNLIFEAMPDYLASVSDTDLDYFLDIIRDRVWGRVKSNARLLSIISNEGLARFFRSSGGVDKTVRGKVSGGERAEPVTWETFPGKYTRYRVAGSGGGVTWNRVKLLDEAGDAVLRRFVKEGGVPWRQFKGAVTKDEVKAFRNFVAEMLSVKKTPESAKAVKGEVGNKLSPLDQLTDIARQIAEERGILFSAARSTGGEVGRRKLIFGFESHYMSNPLLTTLEYYTVDEARIALGMLMEKVGKEGVIGLVVLAEGESGDVINTLMIIPQVGKIGLSVVEEPDYVKPGRRAEDDEIEEDIDNRRSREWVGQAPIRKKRKGTRGGVELDESRIVSQQRNIEQRLGAEIDYMMKEIRKPDHMAGVVIHKDEASFTVSKGGEAPDVSNTMTFNNRSMLQVISFMTSSKLKGYQGFRVAVQYDDSNVTGATILYNIVIQTF